MATITKRGNGWRAQVRRRGYNPVTATFDTQRDAKIWVAEIEAKMSRGQWHDADDSTKTKLATALQRYMTEVTPHKKGAKQEINRIKILLKLPLAEWNLAEIRGQQIAEYRDKRTAAGMSPSTIRNELTIISQVFETAAKEWGMYSLRNPVEHVKRPKQRRGRQRRLLPGEEEQLIDQLREPYRSAIIIALETALRRSEICRMRWDDVDLTKRTAKIRDTKNGEDRIIPLSPRAIAIIDAQSRDNERVFRISSPDSYSQAFLWACKQTGLDDLRLHDLRHEATSRLVECGLFELAEVMKITGHKTLAAFGIYMHIQAEKLADRMHKNNEAKGK